MKRKDAADKWLELQSWKEEMAADEKRQEENTKKRAVLCGQLAWIVAEFCKWYEANPAAKKLNCPMVDPMWCLLDDLYRIDDPLWYGQTEEEKK